MDTIKAANKIIKEGIDLLPDEAKQDFKTQAGDDLFVYDAINNASGMVHDDPEKEALLRAYAVQEANRVVTTLWREKLLPDMLEAAYRALPSMKEMADAYNVFLDARKERLEAAMEQHKAISQEEKNLDIFKGVINGMSKKESERKYDVFKMQQQQALAGGR